MARFDSAEHGILGGDAAARRAHDRALVEDVVAGSRAAWEALVAQQSAHVRHVIRAALGRQSREHWVDDIESALFLKLAVDDFRRLRAYRGDASLKTWLRVMASNLATDQLRQLRPTTELGVGAHEPADPAPSPFEVAARREAAARLRELWEELSPADQRFVDLFFVRELSFSEIAERTGATPGALYARKNRIRKQLTRLAEARGWST